MTATNRPAPPFKTQAVFIRCLLCFVGGGASLQKPRLVALGARSLPSLFAVFCFARFYERRRHPGGTGVRVSILLLCDVSLGVLLLGSDQAEPLN